MTMKHGSNILNLAEIITGDEPSLNRVVNIGFQGEILEKPGYKQDKIKKKFYTTDVNSLRKEVTTHYWDRQEDRVLHSYDRSVDLPMASQLLKVHYCFSVPADADLDFERDLLDGEMTIQVVDSGTYPPRQFARAFVGPRLTNLRVLGLGKVTGKERAYLFETGYLGTIRDLAEGILAEPQERMTAKDYTLALNGYQSLLSQTVDIFKGKGSGIDWSC